MPSPSMKRESFPAYSRKRAKMPLETIEKKTGKFSVDEHGRFGGEFGGRFVPETLVPALDQVAETYEAAKNDPEFWREFNYYADRFIGRPTPLYFAEKMTQELGGAKVYFKREDLAHTGAHKINNAVG